MDARSDVDRLGPVTVSQLAALAEELGVPMAVTTARVLSEAPDAYARELAGGRPVCVLWKEHELFGHFILLLPRAGRAEIEVFDPLADPPGTSLAGRQPARISELNHDGVGEVLDRLVGGGWSVSYAERGPQAPTADSCGLWCLLRAVRPDLSPSEWLSRVLN